MVLRGRRWTTWNLVSPLLRGERIEEADRPDAVHANGQSMVHHILRVFDL